MFELKVLHISAGVLAIAAGALALYARKGAPLHRKAGWFFVCAMLAMSASGAMMATVRSVETAGNATRAVKFQFDAIGGVLTFYLVATALLTVRRPARGARWIDIGAMLVALAVGVVMMRGGIGALSSVTGTTGGYPPPIFFAFAGVALLSALGDLRTMLGAPLQGARRLTRHLWRMCFALFIATGSFFLGQAKVFPEPIRIVPLLAVPVVLVLLLMLYWLVRVRWMRRVPHVPQGAD